MVKYCPECKSIMYPSKEDPEILVCRNNKCGYKMKTKLEDRIITTPSKDKELKIIEDELDTLPTAEVICSKCDNDKARWFLRQTRAADEPTTRFYICTKCGHRWREY